MACNLNTVEVEFIDKTIADLKDENERLREQLESIVSRSFRTADKMACLEAENAKLREQIHWLKKGDILHVLTDQEFAEQQKHEREMQASIKALDDENAKLRELVRDMNKWLWNGADCTECPFAAKCDLNAAFESDIHAHICLGWSEIHDRMRELGVDA